MSNENSHPDARTRLVEATIRLLSTNGPSDVKARSISNEAGLSTMGVYTHFGGVPELLQAVADEGFKRLASVLGRASVTEDPIADLCAMVLACRDFAQGNPHLYDLMFGLSIDGRYSPARSTSTPPSSRHSGAFDMAYSVLLKACTRLVDAKLVRKIDPGLIGRQLWSVAHGFIMLELAGHFAEVANPSSEILVPTSNNVVIGMGAKRRIVEATTTRVVAEWEQSASTS